MSLLLPPLSHYLDDPTTSSTATTSDNTNVTPTTKKKGLTRSATLASRFNKHTAEPKPTKSLKRSLSVSATGRSERQQNHHHQQQQPQQQQQQQQQQQLSLQPIKQDGHWDETAPWEMYFDPNYTFFGGTVLDPRRRKRQQDVLKSMALHDYHLHLHPPPSAAASTAADQLQQPSLPYTVMDAVHHQHYATIDSTSQDIEQNMSPSSVQTMYYPAESSPTMGGGGSHLNQQDHQARLALLQAIRTESYQPTTTSTSIMTTTNCTASATTKKQDTPMTASTTTVVVPTAVTAAVAPVAASSNRHRRYRDPSRYIWMETPSPTQDEKTHGSSTFDLTSFQETGNVSSTHKPIATTTVHNTQESSERRYRTSFLYFLFGFLFPPVWVIGALYTPPEHQHAYQSSQGRRIDLMWKRACRMAFALFIFGLLVMVVIILALNPGALGWRTSRTDLNSAQQFIPVVAQ